MTLRRVLIAYLVLLHLALAIVGGTLLWSQHRLWILLLEVILLVSAGLGIYLIRTQSLPDRLAKICSEWMRERDFSHALRETGTADVKKLVELYNQMVSQLREERLRNEEKEQFLQKVLEASPSGVVTADHDGRVRASNPAAAQLLGVEMEKLIGVEPTGSDQPTVRQVGEIPLGESRLLRVSGHRRVRCTHSRFFDRGFPRSFFLVEDLTQELWSTEKQAYDRVLRTLSHEVNNTLGATSSILESAMVYGEQLESAPGRELSSALQVAIDRARNLNLFMQRYAEVVRVPAPMKQPTSLSTMIERVARLVEPECSQKGIEVVLDLPEEEVNRTIDVVQMEQVLTNVVRNAIEAIGSSGRVRLVLEEGAGRTVLAVEDSGPGLSEEAREKLFTPFFSTKQNGQGVGLMLVQEILNQHGCDFGIDSPSAGPTRFWISFADEM